MNEIIIKIKNGSGIHIKESQKGSFTRYCNGKVTDECIKKGKNSPDPKIRKKATFAANARKWKHQQGGTVQTKNKFFNKIGDFLGSQGGQSLLNTGLGLLQTKSQNEKIGAAAEQQKAQNELDFQQMLEDINQKSLQEQNDAYAQWVQNYQSGATPDNPSEIVMAHQAQQQLGQNINKAKNELNRKNKMVDMQANQAKSENTSNAIGNILQTGMGLIGNYYTQKKATV